MNKVLSFGGKAVKGLLFLVLITLMIVMASIPLSRLSSPELNPSGDWSANLSRSQLITNVHLVDVRDGKSIADQAVLIENGKIARTGNSGVMLAEFGDGNAIEIDGKGQYLTPGLVDAHVHVFDPQDLGLYLSHGITTVRNMAGMPVHLRWQELAAQNDVLGARLVSYSPALNAGDDMGPFHQNVQSPEHARALVQKFAEMGYQGIKVYNGLSLAMTEAIIDEASKFDLRVAGHPSNQYPFEQAINLPLASVEHIEELFQVGLQFKATKATVADLAQKVADSKMPIVSTLVAFDNIYQAAEKGQAFKQEIDWDYLTGFTAFVGEKQLSPQLSGDVGDWEAKKTRAHFAITKSLFEKNAIVAIGSDTGPALTMPGLSFHRELEILNELKIAKAQILKAATISSSNLVDNDLICGEIKVGCFADLLLVKNNPLKNVGTLKEPESVFLQGAHLNRKQLLELREQGKKHHSFYTVMGWLLESLAQ